MSVLRPGLLDGIAVTLAGDPSVADRLIELGARAGDAELDRRALVFDAAGSFGPGGDANLMAMLEAAWEAIQQVAPDLVAAQRPGKLILIAPRPDAGPLAGAAADALENLARTLSVEWARHGITTCAVSPGQTTTMDELAELVAYLLSPAGAYFTGCRLQLGSVDQSPGAGSSAQGTITASS